MQRSGSEAPLSPIGLETGRQEMSGPVNVEDGFSWESVPTTMDSTMEAGSEPSQTSVFPPLSAAVVFPEPSQENQPFPLPAFLPSETILLEEPLFVSTPPPLSPASPGSNPEHWPEYFSQVDGQYFGVNYASAITEAEIIPPAASADLSSFSSFRLPSLQRTETSQVDMMSPSVPPPSLELPSRPQQGQKHGRPSPEPATEKPAKRVKKSSGNTEQEPAMGVKTILSWFEEDEYPEATVEVFKVFCHNVKHYIQETNSFTPPSKKDLDEIREQLHALPFHRGVTNLLLSQSGILDDGLRAIYMKPEVFPADMTDFASELNWKWTNNRQPPSIYHGLALQMTSKNGKFNKNWKFEDATIRPQVSSFYFGEGHLYNGQWWPKNYLAQRDGAHGNSMTGIHGTKANGAYSIVMSKFEENGEDEDNGDEITYCGQAGKGGKIPEGTQALQKSAERRNEIRVLRTAKLPKSNPYRPEHGIRYDGVYKIVSVEEMTNAKGKSKDDDKEDDEQPAKTGKGKKPKKEKKKADKEEEDEEKTDGKKGSKKKGDDKKVTHRFVLRRVAGQSPLCPTDTPGARPTTKEIEEYETAESLHELAFQSARRQVEAGPQTQASQIQTPVEEHDAEIDAEGDVEETEDVMVQAALQQSLQ